MRKVPTVRPAVQAQSSYFTLTMSKKSICSTGVKLASPRLFLPRCVIYYYLLSKPSLAKNIRLPGRCNALYLLHLYLNNVLTHYCNFWQTTLHSSRPSRKHNDWPARAKVPQMCPAAATMTSEGIYIKTDEVGRGRRRRKKRARRTDTLFRDGYNIPARERERKMSCNGVLFSAREWKVEWTGRFLFCREWGRWGEDEN